MRATLIFPGIVLSGWGSFGQGGISENFVPYGLAYISAYAKKEGHDIDLLDFRKLSGWDNFESEVKKRSPGVFGISVMSIDFPSAVEAASRIKAVDSSSIVIIGGVHPTVALEEVRELRQIDHIITREGEISFSRLLSKIEKGEPREKVIEGIPADIGTIPYPDRDIFDYENGEASNPWMPFMEKPFVSIIAGRGCPFNCSFCQPAERMIFGGRAKIRTVPDIIGELEYLRERYKFNSLLIHDDLFTVNSHHVLEFCRAYREEGLPQSFACQARADFIVKNEAAVKEMAETGLKCFLIGFESGSQRILDLLKKGTTVAQNIAAAEICKKYGVSIFANFMLGIPGETAGEVKETVRLIREIRPAYPSLAFFTPYPGTELGDYCAKNGLLLKKAGAFYNRSSSAEGKLKGIDYTFLKAAAERAQDYDRKSLYPSYPGESAGAAGSHGFASRVWKKFRTQTTGAFAKKVFQYLRWRWLYLRYGLY
ncbi:MAG: radical SAM protein [Elusimicrobia bacterium]|nr:radical SAM protein [Elusimicrobiota bacterium]